MGLRFRQPIFLFGKLYFIYIDDNTYKKHRYLKWKWWIEKKGKLMQILFYLDLQWDEGVSAYFVAFLKFFFFVAVSYVFGTCKCGLVGVWSSKGYKTQNVEQIYSFRSCLIWSNLIEGLTTSYQMPCYTNELSIAFRESLFFFALKSLRTWLWTCYINTKYV